MSKKSKKPPSAESQKRRAVLKKHISILNTLVQADDQSGEKQTDVPIRYLKKMSRFLSNALTCEKKKEGSVQIDRFDQENGSHAVTALFINNQGTLFLHTAYKEISHDLAKSPTRSKFVRLLLDQNSGEALTVASNGKKHEIVPCTRSQSKSMVMNVRPL